MNNLEKEITNNLKTIIENLNKEIKKAKENNLLVEFYPYGNCLKSARDEVIEIKVLKEVSL